MNGIEWLAYSMPSGKKIYSVIDQTKMGSLPVTLLLIFPNLLEFNCSNAWAPSIQHDVCREWMEKSRFRSFHSVPWTGACCVAFVPIPFVPSRPRIGIALRLFVLRSFFAYTHLLPNKLFTSLTINAARL